MTDAPAPASLQGRLPGLDALRGVAALCVVLLHTHVLMPEFPDLIGRGYLAVDFFFVLSGYVMARTYEARMAGGMSAARFLGARYRRLWPTMLIGALLFLPFIEEGAKDEDVRLLLPLVLNLALLPSPITKNFFPLNIPAWSIFFELVANALHGTLFRRLGIAALSALCIAALAGLTREASRLGDLDIGSQNGEMLAGLLRVTFTYTLGIILWRTWGERRLHPLAGLAALVAMPLLFAFPAPLPGLAWKADIAFVALAAPLLLIGGLALRNGAAVAQLAGELSFPLYAVHYPVLYWCRTAHFPASMAILACLLMAWLVARVTAALPEPRSLALHAR